MKKYVLFVFVGLAGLTILMLFEYQKTADGKLHLIFCDVGQGDGILIKSPSGKLLIIDGGPDESIMSCLSKHTVFWQKTIDMHVLTHPHSDHFMGMFSVYPVYSVKSHISETLANRSESYKELVNLVKNEGLEITYVKRGTKIDLGDGVILTVLAPTDAYIRQTSPGGFIGETEDNASLVVLVTYGTFTAILSGDSEVSGMYVADPPNVDVLHVPHHGSRFGLDEQVVHQIDPEVAIISVGKNNYGHPAGETLSLLEDQRAKILRTDELGDIEIVSDGRKYLINQ